MIRKIIYITVFALLLQTNLAIAALGNEAADSQGRAETLKTLGGFGIDIWKEIRGD